MKKVVIASDSFKGSLSSMEVADAAASGVHAIYPDCEVIRIHTGDGGEGTVKALSQTKNGHTETAQVSDPIGRRIQAEYFIVEEGCRTAIMEMAAANGLTLLDDEERNPILTSTYGTGEMILDALSKGCRKFIIGIGGSATNDGGTGMLEALGCTFLNEEGNKISEMCGGKTVQIKSIDTTGIDQRITESEFIVICDVNTPFCGPDGATHIFSAQKGATEEMMHELETGMQNLNMIVRHECGTDLSKVSGSGAAGGLGGAFHAFLHAKLTKGIDTILDSIGFDETIKGADLIITGEGKIDSQTENGKVITGVQQRAASQGIPAIAIAGIVALHDENEISKAFKAIIRTSPAIHDENDLKNAMHPETAAENIRKAVTAFLSDNLKG